MKFGRITAILVVAIALTSGVSSSASASSSSTSAQVAKAKQAVQSYLKVPKKVESTPLPKRPPSGETVVYLECDNAACTLDGEGAQAAAKLIGWNFKEIPFQLANPSSLISAMDSALQLQPKPAFVVEVGVPEAAFAGEIPKYKAAGVGIVVNTAGTIKPDQTLLGYSKGERYSELDAEMLGNWFIADSGGKGHVLVQTFPSVAFSAQMTADFQAVVAKGCSQCTVSIVDISLVQLATDGGVSPTISAVQANPAINYVISPVFTAALGLKTALDTAGKTNIKIAGQGGEYANYVDIANGTESAWVNFSTIASGYVDIDAGLHGLAGGKTQYKHDIDPPLVLVTKANLAKLGGPQAAKATGAFEVPANYPQQYAALWHVKYKK